MSPLNQALLMECQFRHKSVSVGYMFPEETLFQKEYHCTFNHGEYGTLIACIANMNHHWYALYVKSRHEFVTERELTRKGVEAFLPSVRLLRQWRDRKKWVDFPVFPGYLFVHIEPTPEKMLRVLRTIGAVRLLSSSPGCPVPVPDEEIESLKILLQSGRQIDVYPHLKEGMQVRIKRGVLNGAVGTLVRKEEDYMIFVNVRLLGRSVGVKVHATDVEEF